MTQMYNLLVTKMRLPRFLSKSRCTIPFKAFAGEKEYVEISDTFNIVISSLIVMTIFTLLLKTWMM